VNNIDFNEHLELNGWALCQEYLTIGLSVKGIQRLCGLSGVLDGWTVSGVHDGLAVCQGYLTVDCL